MAKSLSDIVRDTTATKNTQLNLGSLPEYVASDTDELYVVGVKDNENVKIKVRSNSCCEGIELVGGGGGGETDVTTALKQGKSYTTFQALYDERNILEVNTIYNVTDKGTTEQYVCIPGADGIGKVISQVSGGINVILENKEVSDCPLDLNSGEVNYALPELICGDYFFKGHKELRKFIGDMPSLKSGVDMFKDTSLTVFLGELSSLTNGRGMFGKGVKLDYDSIISIVDSLSKMTDDEIHSIHIGYDTKLVTSDDISEFEKELTQKGWSFTWYPDGQEPINTFRLKRN